jgi:hypothetical protein
MNRTTAVSTALLWAVMTLSACSPALPVGDPGSLALAPFSAGEMGIRGMAPAGRPQVAPGVFECVGLASDQSLAFLSQQAHPGALDELMPAFLAETGLTALPKPVGTFRGRALIWDVYELETRELHLQAPGLTGDELWRLDLAVAQRDSESYIVALGTLPADYQPHRALYQTLFRHALYALQRID